MSVFRRAAERRGTPANYLVLGLGNPGDRFLGTRHNLGCEVVEQFAEGVGASLRVSRSDRARVATVNFSDLRVVLACPTTFMNLSGESAAPLIRRNGIEKVVEVKLNSQENIMFKRSFEAVKKLVAETGV